MQGEIRWLQALRGVAVLLVVLFHVALQERATIPSMQYLEFFIYFGYGGVNLFFVISGFIMVYISLGRWGYRAQWRDFVLRRMIRIYPTYWAVFLITVAVFSGYYGKQSCLGGDWGKTIGAITLARDPRDMCFVPQAWTLHWELLFYLTFSAVFFVGHKWAIRLGVIWAIASAAVIAFARDGVSEDIFNYCIYNLHFLAGAALCLFYARTDLRYPVIWVSGGALLFVLAGILNSRGMMDTEDTLHRLAQFVPASLMLLLGALGLEKRDIAVPTWLLLIGNASYSIYLIHLTTFLAFRRATAGMVHTPATHLIWVIGLVAVAIIPGVLIHYAFERPAIKLGKRAIPRSSLAN
ncbi:acyltransferase family protein [Rhizobium cremeum]|uniref:acyltransferase family protein n=1 Tax=Rhizobium cremeum TaxID=2813827 RepID=UPI0039E0C6E1